MTQQATTGAARESRAGPDRPNLSHLPLEPSPVYVQQAEERARSLENRVADQITTFAGSMRFVYLHILWFGCWIGFGAESYPFGLLTMIVSLEAIFLSTFVMISQNRADAKRQAIAEQQWQTVQEEDRQNEELLQLSHQILELTRAIHADTTPLDASSREPLSPSSGSSASRKSPSLIGVVKPCPGSSGDVVGEEFARLVVEEYREQYQELLARFCLARVGGVHASDSRCTWSARADRGERGALERRGRRRRASSARAAACEDLGGGAESASTSGIRADATPARRLAAARRGRSTQQIASALSLSPTTVRNYTAKILAALGAHTRLQAVVVAKHRGLVWPEYLGPAGGRGPKPWQRDRDARQSSGRGARKAARNPRKEQP